MGVGAMCMSNRYDEYGARIVAEWSSERGAHWIRATVDEGTEYGGYTASAGGGTPGTVGAQATYEAVQKLVDARRFLPDASKRPMVLRYIAPDVRR